MIPKKWGFVMAAGLLISFRALAGDKTEQQAYCAYVMEQAQAQRDLLRTPTATAAVTQPETGLPMQIVGGASVGLAEVRKAGLTIEAARKDCELYQANFAAQQDLQYAIPSLEKEALRNRVALIEHAAQSLDALMEKTAKMVEAQNATRLMMFTLETAKIKLDGDRADTNSKIAGLYVPELSGKPLKELVAQKQSGEANQQRALDKLSRQNSWDVALSVGVHQQVNPVSQGAQPYGEVTVSYNLATRAINRHLDRAAEAHDEWKRMQEGDVVRNMEVLREQLVESASAQEAKLRSLKAEGIQVEKSLQLVANPDTSAALDFRNQLEVALLLLEIETGDAGFRTDQLREYLRKNY